MKTKLTPTRLRRHVRMAVEGFNTWDVQLKREYLSAAKAVGLEILAQLGVEGDVAILAGGPAVPGGVSVYSEHLYVCVERSCLSPTFYYRGCERQGDCGAGLDWRNQSVPYARLLELAEPDSALIREMRAHMETVHRTKLRRHGEKGGGE